jgi:two-component system KDP operon response regulator KdpE
MQIPYKILIIDDEPQIRKLLQIALTANQFNVDDAANANTGIIKAANYLPDLILLDLGLPDKDGQDGLVELRSWYNNPIIILSVQKDEDNIVNALDNGATDYLIKPFRTGELMARIRSALRNMNSFKNEPVKKFNNLTIDWTNRVVKKHDEFLKLTQTEFNLLSLMAQNEGKVLTHQFLLKEIWGPTYLNETQYLRVFVGQLRKKIEDDYTSPIIIQTESGVGYRFTGS